MSPEPVVDGMKSPGLLNFAQWRLLVLSLVVGVIAGLGAIAFHLLLDVASHFLLGGVAGYYPPMPAGEHPILPIPDVQVNRWLLLLLPAVGGLVSGILVYWLAPEAAGHGTDAAIHAYHHRHGAVRARVPFVKAIASAITMGTGGSAGREGPIAQIGAGLGSTLAARLGLTPKQRRTLMAAGMAGGVGAIFSAPLAGALFAAEVLYRDLDLEYEVIVPSVISSAVAYSVFGLWFGWDPVFRMPDFTFQHPGELAPYTALAVVVALGSIAFIKVFYLLHNAFLRLSIPRFLKPALGGLAVGLLGLVVPQAMGTSFGALQQALTLDAPGAQAAGMPLIVGMLALAIGKMLTTSFSIGSGGSGGVFGPSVVIGGALGGVVGLAAMHLMPFLDIQPGAFVLVGMAGFFAAAANTPISTIIIVSEMSGNYHLLLPSMWVCILAYMVAKRCSLYHTQIPSRFDAALHAGAMLQALLRNMTVAQVTAGREPTEVATVRPTTPVREVLEQAVQTHQSGFPVVLGDGELVGFIRDRLLRRMLNSERPFSSLFIAGDLTTQPVTVTPGDSLLTCLQRMAQEEQDEVIILDPDGHRILGILTYANIVAAFQLQMHAPGETDLRQAVQDGV